MANSHVQALLSFGSLVLGAVAHDSVAVRQVEVECDQRAVLQAQGPQCGAVNLQGEGEPQEEDSRGDRLGKLYSWNTLNNNAASIYMRTKHGGNVVFVSMQAPEV